ncbi:MAG: ATP-binding protein [Alphaproteobacteria bacterium]|nr:ATP-binding protein [Alphaproteobacteria bacterium]
MNGRLCDIMDELTERFWNMAKLLDEASVLLDAQSNVVAANEAALDILGSHITGYPLDRFLRHPSFADAVRRACNEGELASLDYTRMDRVRRSFTLRIAPFEPGYVLLVIFDGTMGLSVERIRSDFVANVSHELRSPLTALTGFIETLQDGAVEDEGVRLNFLSIMRDEAARMQRLIDNLLHLSRVEAEEHRSPDEAVELLPMLEELASAMRDTALKNDKTINVEIASDLASVTRELPLAVQGQRDELHQVFQNLVENAIRYGTPDSAVRMRVGKGRLVSGQTRDDLLRVQVINKGETIAPEHLARLTERFYRIDKGRSRQMGGTGLGLAIVKHIVNRHKGRLRITSAAEETTVSVTLRRIS